MLFDIYGHAIQASVIVKKMILFDLESILSRCL